MRKQLIRILLVIFIVATCFSMFVVAEARASDYISTRTAYVSASSGGIITVSFSITGTGTMTEIGATRIEIRNSSGALLKTCYSSAFPNLMGYNKTVHTGSVTYPGVIGTSYYAVVYFKAANSSGGDTAAVTTYLVTAK